MSVVRRNHRMQPAIIVMLMILSILAGIGMAPLIFRSPVWFRVPFAARHQESHSNTTLDDCHLHFEGHGIDIQRLLEKALSRFDGVVLEEKLLTSISEVTMYLGHGEVVYSKNTKVFFDEIVQNMVTVLNDMTDFLKIPKNEIPELVVYLSTDDPGVCDVCETQWKPFSALCAHPADVPVTHCTSTLILPIHDNQKMELYDAYYNEIDEFPPFHQRRPVVMWRGGQNEHSYNRLRSRLVQYTRNLKGFDVQFGYKEWSDIVQNKYLLLIDGYGPFSGAMMRVLLSGSVPIVVDHNRTNGQWFELFMNPYEHFIPISSDLSDLNEVAQWLSNTNESFLAAMATRAQQLAKFLVQPKTLYCYTYETLMAYSRIQNIVPGDLERFLRNTSLHRIALPVL